MSISSIVTDQIIAKLEPTLSKLAQDVKFADQGNGSYQLVVSFNINDLQLNDVEKSIIELLVKIL